MPGLIGRKIGMTSVFSAEGKNLPCTVIEVGPCVVTQIKNMERDGYEAVQLAFGDKKEKNTNKAEMGHFAAAGVSPKRHLVEFKGFEKEFKLDTRGYRPQEVDKFLDIIMRDYEEFMAINKELSNEIRDLTNDNMKLKQEIRSLKMKLDILKENADSDSGSNSVDVLKRLSNLEKIIYGKE